MFTKHFCYYDNKNGLNQKGTAYVTHAHINHETYIKSIHKKKWSGGQAGGRSMRVQIFRVYLKERPLVNEVWLLGIAPGTHTYQQGISKRGFLAYDQNGVRAPAHQGRGFVHHDSDSG